MKRISYLAKKKKNILGIYLIESIGCRLFMARSRLKNLKESTLLTFFEVCRMLDLRMDRDYRYNSISGLISFKNGSELYLKDLFLYPSDPEFVGLGSTEYTAGFIDEMGEITEQAYNIMKSRIRFRLDEFGLIPKILMGSNPCKTFVYREFYKKWQNNDLEPWKAYIPGLVNDNPFISEHYIENLKKLDPINKERLLFGNWEYEDDPSKLFDYDKILDIFTNNAKRGNRYCTVDVAGRGKDKTILMVWDGLFIEHIEEQDDISTQELDKFLLKHRVSRSNCIADNDGVGFGLVKDTPGIKGFVNNSSPIKPLKEDEIDKVTRNYRNLKAQCWFLLAQYVNSGLIGCYREIEKDIKTKFIEDLEQIKQDNVDKDSPLSIIPKDKIKENLGRSPDIGDSAMMRMYFELRKPLAFSFT